MNDSKKACILPAIAAIPTMERGKLSTCTFKNRAADAGPYYKVQHWQDGKNHTRYVPAEEVPAVQAALEGYAQFQRLTYEYADLVVAETRQQRATDKKSAAAQPPAGLG